MTIVVKLVVFGCGVHLAMAVCYSFMGLSTCKTTAEIDLRFPFTTCWWVANVHYRVDEIRNAKHILEKTPVWSLVRAFPSLDEVTNTVDTRMFDRIFQQALDYFEERGELVELLADPDVTYGDLYKSFKAHPNEVLGLIDTLIDAHAWDKDIEMFMLTKRSLIRSSALVFAYLPTELFTQYVDIMDKNALTTGVVTSNEQLRNISFSTMDLVQAGGRMFT